MDAIIKVMEEEKVRSEERRILLEARLSSIRENLSKKKYSLRNFIIILIIVGFYIGLISMLVSEDFGEFMSKESLLSFLTGTLVLTVFIFVALPYFGHLLNKFQERNLMAELAILGSEKLQDEIQEDFFTNLVKINFKYIDKYYLQTQIQADKSFSLSLICSVLAFSIIISGIILMYLDNASSAYIATAAGVLSQFVSAVFFYLYNKTIIKMGEYHHKLVLTQNISLALKITEQMPEKEKVISQAKLIEELTKDINKLIASKPELLS